MKKEVLILIAVFFSLTSCSTQKRMVKNPPFTTGEAVCYKWVGGRAESGSGMMIEIPIESNSIDAHSMQQVFFRGKIADIKVENTGDGWVAKSNFKKEDPEEMDMIMHSDPTKEVGNQPPMIPEKFPFELSDDECVISYLNEGKTKYFKLSNIKQGKQKIFQ